MKKMIMALILTMSFSVQANAGIIEFIRKVAQDLEKVRLAQQSVVDIRAQWDTACMLTQTAKPALKALEQLIVDKKINIKVCAPVSQIVRFNIALLDKCQDFYSKPVPENAEHFLGLIGISLFQTKMLFNKCNPELAKLIKLPKLEAPAVPTTP